MPDKGLDTFWDDEVLLRLCQNERQVRQGASQMSAASGRQAGPKYVRNMPRLPSTHRHLARKIMRAHKERIVVQHLRPGWFIVGVIQSHQRVAQERYDQTACVRKILTRVRSLDDLHQIRSRLQ